MVFSEGYLAAADAGNELDSVGERTASVTNIHPDGAHRRTHGNDSGLVNGLAAEMATRSLAGAVAPAFKKRVVLMTFLLACLAGCELPGAGPRFRCGADVNRTPRPGGLISAAGNNILSCRIGCVLR
jgi:hypothetical protein